MNERKQYVCRYESVDIFYEKTILDISYVIEDACIPFFDNESGEIKDEHYVIFIVDNLINEGKYDRRAISYSIFEKNGINVSDFLENGGRIVGLCEVIDIIRPS